MMSIQNWETKLSRTTEILKGLTPFSDDQLKMAASSFYYKLLAADKYAPSKKFMGKVTLLRAKDNYVSLEDDYGLTPVSIHKKRYIVCMQKNYFTILS